MSKEIKITDIHCPLCRINLEQLSGEKMDVLWCSNCGIVYDLKFPHEEWEYVPTVSDIPFKGRDN